MTQIERIRHKIDELQTVDKNFETFGSSRHRYTLNDPISEVEILAFEHKHGIGLPLGYRDFLLQIGNGGAGPYYGLVSLSQSLCADLDYPDANDLIDISKPFPHTEPWNLDFSILPDEDDEAYYTIKDSFYDNSFISGTLKVANFGCGISKILVVNGAEYGHIWVDDRSNDVGIYPETYFGVSERVDFLSWYEHWLDISLAKLP